MDNAVEFATRVYKNQYTAPTVLIFKYRYTPAKEAAKVTIYHSFLVAFIFVLPFPSVEFLGRRDIFSSLLGSARVESKSRGRVEPGGDRASRKSLQK